MQKYPRDDGCGLSITQVASGASCASSASGASGASDVSGPSDASGVHTVRTSCTVSICSARNHHPTTQTVSPN